ncbi:MAG: ImmA/IrrE family metallo-endopeptidase [Pseudobutyrivibrio ruminis]|uniref:ImmA/IrrE family metallo-endopeptidase n=1 Tax=Pseudobutyrivibrio ruminis TaxID=46206 RepID=UPI0026ED1270|nr:ImmA/IrrE family metallo-endopeptidase [Pseudobutyrivibrio ruminis]MBE5912869.1 ImmA/IrrE family metallo-endopeptidase [Pseudobutyrivibrio ruminis]
MSKKDIELTLAELDAIKSLAKQVRMSFGVVSTSVASDIRRILERRDILICEYPFNDIEKNKTYAYLTIITVGTEEYTYIGLNTSIAYDEQLFALAHELYHIETKTGLAYSFESDKEDERVERCADRFAAELLLPEEELKHLVVSEFGTDKLRGVPQTRMLRFIASIQCDYWIPYKSIVKRLKEEKYISHEDYEWLYSIDARSEDGIYYTILKALNEDVANILNRRTETIGISNRGIEYLIQNYEDGIIDDDEFVETLELFGKKPEDYGFDLLDWNDVDDEDFLEFIAPGEEEIES